MWIGERVFALDIPHLIPYSITTMNIINDSNVVIPEWVQSKCRNVVMFNGNRPIVVAPIATETPSRYNGVSIGTNIYITSFGVAGVTYTVKMMKNA